MKKIRSDFVNEVNKIDTSIRSEIIELFVFNSSKYCGRVCYFNRCPRYKPDCGTAGCGNPQYLKLMDDFKLHPEALLRINSETLFEREPIANIPDTNLLANLPSSLPEELIETLVVAKNIRIERIVSTGHSSPPNFWYDQSESEFVIVLQGSAELEFESEVRSLTVGSYALIPPHCKHRVKSTSSSEPTVWLAVFYRD